jgi:preprotein translocase subunit SecG
MNWLYTAAIIVHVLLASAITGLVLLQRGRGADAGAGFGAGASGTVFGARGSASFLSRSTAALAFLFIGTSLILAYLGGQRPAAPSSVTDRVNIEQPVPAPATVPPMLTPAPINSTPATDTPATPPAAAAGDQGPPAPNPQPPSQ